MERWQHDAFLGYMAETFETEKQNNLIKSIENDIIFSGMDRESIIFSNSTKFRIAPSEVEELYNILIERL